MELAGLMQRWVGGAGAALAANPAVARRFEVLAELGAGSFGRVYQVRRRADQRLYALKHVDLACVQPGERAGVVADLVNEIRLLAGLDHPHILSFHEAFVESHHLFLVTELAAGGDLAALLGRREEAGEPLPEREVWAYFLQLALALAALHRRRVLHRDIKPQNVLIGTGGILKLADLGISMVLEQDQALTHELTGTPEYVAPEMWLRQPYSYPADVWALGCTLQELCSLKPLFYAPSTYEVRERVLSGLLDPLPSSYSRELWELTRALLAPLPEERPSVAEVLGLPSVQGRLHLLPPESRALLEDQSPGGVSAPLPAHIEVVPADLEGRWEELNALLPPPRYPTPPAAARRPQRRRGGSVERLALLEEGGPTDAEGEADGGLYHGHPPPVAAGWLPSRRAAARALPALLAGLLFLSLSCLLFDCWAWLRLGA